MQQQPPILSVVICTYNRADLLSYCLESLGDQGMNTSWELLLIDNNCTDGTPGLVDDFFTANPQIRGRRIVEAKQGLSHARNRGYAEAAADWVLYLDDDAKARPGFVARALWLLRETDFRVVGGVYRPWYHFGKPVWYRDAYASNELHYSTLTVPGGNYIATGGVMLWEKKLLIDLGGFDPRVGMVGNKLAYGEETYLQEQVKQRNIPIAYDPELLIYHVVMEQKLNLDWFFRSYFAAGRDAVLGGRIKPTFGNLVLLFLVGSGVLLKDFIICTPKLLGKDYHRQNWLIDVFRKFAKRVGSIYTGILLPPSA